MLPSIIYFVILFLFDGRWYLSNDIAIGNYDDAKYISWNNFQFTNG